MKHQAENQNVRSMVYQYGTVPARVVPVGGESEAMAQLKLARRLWNVLVTIERVRVAAYRRIMQDDEQAEIDRLRARMQELSEQKKAQSKQARKRVPTPELDEELKRARAALTMLIEHHKSTQKERHDARRAELDALNERVWKRNKRARQAAGRMGLFWGTYNAVMQSADTGRKLGELKYRSFRGEGTVTAQIIGGAAPAACIAGTHTFFQIDPPTAGQKWRNARVRIGSTADRAPVWIALPIVYHREIPANAQIKSVCATRHVVAGHPRWTLNVTVTLPPAVAAKTTGPALAVDIGWRLLPDGVRVGYWQDDAGKHGQILVVNRDLEAFKKIRDLRSITDCARDQFLPPLVDWLAQRELDADWQQRTSHLAQWRSGDRVAGLIRWWSDHRLPGDEEIHREAVEWRRQYLHLTNWWRNQQDQMTLRLREQYRVFAARVAADYRVLILEDFDLTQITQPAADDDKAKAGATYRQMVSPSMFRAALLNACRREGVEIRIVPGAYSTSTCHACRQVEVWDQAASVIHRCGVCGALWDQDQNAAINLLASGKAVPSKDQQDSPAVSPEIMDRSQTEMKGGMESAA